MKLHRKFSLFIGGIKNFTMKDETYEKWVLTRPFQAKFVDALLNQVNLDSNANNPRKCLRSAEVTKSEKRVRSIAKVLKVDFINPWGPELEKDRL